MKKLLVLLGFTSFFAFRIADVFTDLGITKTQVEDFINRSLAGDVFFAPGSVTKVPLESRVSIVQAIGSFAKSYTKTDDFKNRYAEWWKSQEPVKPETAEARIAREKAEQAKGAADAEKSQKEMVQMMKKQIAETKDAAIKKQLEEALKSSVDVQAELKKEMESPDYTEQMKEMQAIAARAYTDEYKEKSKKYTSDYAYWKTIQNPNVLIKQRLNRFLEISSTVDFNAQLKTVNNRKKFVKEEYEQKNDTWRRCFRAGKPAVDAARAIAQEWLKEV
jgi:hypothetical protein